MKKAFVTWKENQVAEAFSLDFGKFFTIILCAVHLRKGKFDATIIEKSSHDIEDQTDEGRGAIRMKDWKKEK